MQSDIDSFLTDIRGVIHVGANTGQERDIYRAHRLNVVWIEPIPSVFATLTGNLAEFPGQYAYQALITDKDNEEHQFNIANNDGASSSILDLNRHKEIWPDVSYQSSITLKSMTLPSLISRQHIDMTQYDALVIDTQGAELLVIKGAEQILDKFKYIKAELPDFDAYSGCCQVHEFTEFLARHGFHEQTRRMFASHAGVGRYYDIVYRKNTLAESAEGRLRIYSCERTKPESIYLRKFQKNIMSQNGEDGIIEYLFDKILGTSNQWVVEFGAWDGKHHSNSWNLINNLGWKAVLIEGNSAKFLELLDTYAHNPNVVPVNTYVGIDKGRDSLDSILSAYSIPADIDVLSIDIDGCDWYVWETLTEYRPRLVVIEFNPTIPNHVSFVQARDPTVNQGSSLRALIDLGKRKNYELVATTQWNAFFVRSEDFPRFGIEDNSIDSMHSLDEFASTFFQLFDGTVVLAGCSRLLWHNLPISANDIQVLPAALRKFGDAVTADSYTVTRLADLTLLQRALARYHADTGRYPVSVGFDGLYTAWGRAGEDWIAGLAPIRIGIFFA